MELSEIIKIVGDAVMESTSDPIHVQRKDVPGSLLGNYTGNKIKIKLCTSVSVPEDAGQWSGGSRDTYVVVQIATGNQLKAEGLVKLEPGFAVVRHSIFLGKDSGLTIYALPDDMTPLLKKDDGAELSEKQLKVLAICKGYKSAYRVNAAAYNDISLKEYEELKQSLVALGLLDTRGAVTLQGKNTPTPRVNG